MLNMDWHKFYIVCVCKWERESHQVFVRAVLFACLFPQSTVMLLWWRNTYSGQLGVTLQTKYRSFKLTITHIHSCQLAWTVSQCFSVYDSRRCRRTVEIHSFIHFIRPNMLRSSSDFIVFFFLVLGSCYLRVFKAELHFVTKRCWENIIVVRSTSVFRDWKITLTKLIKAQNALQLKTQWREMCFY